MGSSLKVERSRTLAYRRMIASFMMGMMVLTAAAPLPARAGVWGEGLLSMTLKQVLEVIWEQISALLLGIAKRIAVTMAKDAADRLTAGGGAKKATFITDYKEYIYAVALDESLIYMNDLLTTATSGKNSSLNYVIAGGSLQRLGMNYMNYLNAEVKSSFQKARCQYNLDQYTPNAVVSLGQGDWRVLNASISHNCNNPLGMSLIIQDETMRKMQQQQETAKTKAVAGNGFKGVEKDGKTVSPGSIIGEITSETNKAVVKAIGSSSKWGELLAAAASSFVNQSLNNLYQRGFEQVSKNLSRELGKVDKKIGAARKDLAEQLGPGSQFLRSANQQLGGGGGSNAGKYTGAQQSLVQFNTPNCTVDQGC